MSEPEREEIYATDSLDAFRPRWSGCVGTFADTFAQSSRENEETHYRKHCVVGREWEQDVSLTDYRNKATRHLNNVSDESVIELCQAEDLAVVKYDLETGELGIARRDDGSIKTFFRPGDHWYVTRKVTAGLWGEPDIVDGYVEQPASFEFSNAETRMHYQRLEDIALEIVPQSHALVLSFSEGDPIAGELFSFLARLGEYRFVAFELQRSIMTEEQDVAIFSLQKKIAIATVSFEALERYRESELVGLTEECFENSLISQEELWPTANDLIKSSDQLECSLIDRRALGYAMLQLRVLQIHGRLTALDLFSFEQRLKRNDIYFRSAMFSLNPLFGNGLTNEIRSTIL